MEQSPVFIRVTDLLNEEISKGVNAKLTKYAEFVSRRYDISLNLLLDDMRNIDILEIPKMEHPDCDSGQCLGTKSTTGKRCKLKGKHNGYCRWHKEQKPQRVPSRTFLAEADTVQHNHTLPPLFKAGCPACERSNTNAHTQKLLIDF